MHCSVFWENISWTIGATLLNYVYIVEHIVSFTSPTTEPLIHLFPAAYSLNEQFTDTEAAYFQIQAMLAKDFLFFLRLIVMQTHSSNIC